MGGDERCTLHEVRALFAPHAPRRASADMEHNQGRHEHSRAASGKSVFLQQIRAFRAGLLRQAGGSSGAGGYELGPEEKIIYDMEYIHNRSVKMDVYCILKTVGVVLKREGAK